MTGLCISVGQTCLFAPGGTELALAPNPEVDYADLNWRKQGKGWPVKGHLKKLTAFNEGGQ